MTPAAVHCGAPVRAIGPGVWVEPVGRAIIMHAEDDGLLVRVAAAVGRNAITPSLGPNGIFTIYFISRHAERAVALARVGALPHIVAPAVAPANDTTRAR